jgi:hypothetical protein
MKRLSLFLLPVLLHLQCAAPDQPAVTVMPYVLHWDPFLDSLQLRTIRYFLDTTPFSTGMATDRYPTPSPASIASVGFALTVFPVAVERGVITRGEAAQRTANTLRHFVALPQRETTDSTAGYRGFFYHWLRLSDNHREWNCELSSIDTGLMMAGVLFAMSYFDGPSVLEAEIRQRADSLYRRVDWKWFSEGREGIAFAWDPREGFTKESWYGYNEAMIMYVLGFGSPTFPASPRGWEHWTAHYQWGKYYGLEFVNFGPLFGHQYSHCWIDFRGIQDVYMRHKGIDYFENSRRATYAQYAYAQQNPTHWRGYSATTWGWTACDGPGDTAFAVDGVRRKFGSYSARGVSFDWSEDDGTLAPTAPASSIPFAPEICVPAVKAMAEQYGPPLWRQYGFADAFNPTFITPHTPNGWFDKDYIGIDQGPIVLMIENARNEFVWNIMKKNPYMVAGLRKAGFSGGWLEQH